MFINSISARSAPKVWSMKGKCTFLFSNSLIIGLCNISANSLFDIFSILTAAVFRVAKVFHCASVAAPPEVFYQRIYKPLKQAHDDICHSLDF